MTEEAKNGSAPHQSKAMDPQELQRLVKETRLRNLLAGQVPPPNEFAGFIIEQLRTTMTQGQQISRKLSQARATVKEFEEEGLRLEGVANQYARDLDKWDKPVGTGATPEGNKDELTNPPS